MKKDAHIQILRILSKYKRGGKERESEDFNMTSECLVCNFSQASLAQNHSAMQSHRPFTAMAEKNWSENMELYTTAATITSLTETKTRAETQDCPHGISGQRPGDEDWGNRLQWPEFCLSNLTSTFDEVCCPLVKTDNKAKLFPVYPQQHTPSSTTWRQNEPPLTQIRLTCVGHIPQP